MSGMSGEAEEHPAKRRAVEKMVVSQIVHTGGNREGSNDAPDLHSNIIAIAISIMRTWW
jgi:hypothetical protein